MATLDGDWECYEGGFCCDQCFAIWQFCDNCTDTATPDLNFPYNGGLVSAGEGLPIDEHEGNIWHDDADCIRGKYDLCPFCTGSGGGYICGFHDVDQGSDDSGKET